jgi:putative tricarboxylic transport membrane protein
VIAYLMEENGFPVAPAILGLVLGPLLQETFMTSMIKSGGDLLAFFERPIAAGLGLATILIWLWPLLTRIQRHFRTGSVRT